MTELESTLSKALTFAKIQELPESVELGSNEWTKAVVLVRKTNNRTNYAIAHNDGMGNPQIMADFGALCGIKEILEIHPYSRPKPIFQPVFKTKDDIINYLVNHGEDREEIESLASDKFPNNRAKSAKRKEEDNSKIKALIAKYTIVDENIVRNAREKDFETAFADRFLPDVETPKTESDGDEDF